jgi:hypothetical protein
MASGRRGESKLMMPYDRNLVIAMRASEVMGAEVDEERMTWRKGWSIEGVSKVLISGVALAQLEYMPTMVSTHLYSP